jgi:hypothetical protein
MATVNLGRIKPTWQGTWSSSTSYVADDIVAYNSDTWIAVATNTNSAPSDGNANWDLVARGVSAGSVTSTELADGAVTAAKLAPGAAVPDQTGNAGKALVTDGSNLSWGDGGGVLQVKKVHWTATSSMQSNTYVSIPLALSITPKSSTSSFYIDAWINMQPMNHDSNAVLNIHDSALGGSPQATSQHCFQYTPDQGQGSNNRNIGYMNFWSTGSIASPDDYRSAMTNVSGLYTPASASSSARTFTVVARNHLTTSSNGFYFNYGQQDHPHQSVGTSYMMVWEIANSAVA